MGFRDVLAIVTSEKGDDHVLRYAEQLAAQHAAKVSGLVVNWMPSAPLTAEWGVGNPWWGELVGDARKKLDEEGARVKTRFAREGEGGSAETCLLEIAIARPELGLRARHADLSIVARPTEATSNSAHAILEGPLFESGRPIILVPPNWKPRDIGKSVMICWKPTREAARSLADAEPFLATASRMAVVTVDARPSEGGYGPLPGIDITAHLARRGHKPELFNIASSGRTEAAAILDQARALDADLLVMGGFGRSRMSEFIFGGVTRDVLAKSDVPVLMSH